MAFRRAKKLGIIDFIHPKDPAIDLENSDLENYREDWDFEKHCKLLPDEEPTVFKINFEIPYKKALAVDNSVVSTGKKGRVSITVATQIHQAVKTFLAGIENPDCVPKEDQIPYKKEGGLVADGTIAELLDLKLLDDLYQFWSDRHNQEKSGDELLKKSS